VFMTLAFAGYLAVTFLSSRTTIVNQVMSLERELIRVSDFIKHAYPTNQTHGESDYAASEAAGFISVIGTWAANLEDARSAVGAAIDIGALVGLISSLWALHAACKAHRTIALDLQARGTAGHGDTRHYTYKQVPKFVGCMLSTFVTGFLVVSLLTALVAIPFTTGFMWYIFEDYWVILVAMVMFKVLMLVVVEPLFIEGYLTDGTYILRPRMYAAALPVLIFFQVFIGIVAALVRLLFMAILLFIVLLRIDITLFPPEWLAFDEAYCSFVAVVFGHHRTANPTMHVAIEVWREATKQNKLKSSKQLRYERVCRKWQMAYFLYRNPALILHRKYRTHISNASSVANAASLNTHGCGVSLPEGGTRAEPLQLYEKWAGVASHIHATPRGLSSAGVLPSPPPLLGTDLFQQSRPA